MAEGMDKAGLLSLIGRINTRENCADSRDSVSWKALREAETLTDAALFPLLREIVTEHEGKKREAREVRSAAYFIYGRLTEHCYRPEDCAFFLQRLEAETDKHVLSAMLDRIRDWNQRKGILLPAEVDTEPVRRLTGSDKWLIRHSAIRALSACPGPESRETLHRFLLQEDEKAYRYEIQYANVALQSIGEPEDLPLLERFLKSRRPDIKITAQYAIQRIQSRRP